MVFVLNKDKTPLSPCHQAVARQLLKEGKAAVWRKYPFAIILKEQKETQAAAGAKDIIDTNSDGSTVTDSNTGISIAAIPGTNINSNTDIDAEQQCNASIGINPDPKPSQQEYRLKVDFGSHHTGLAILQGNKVIWMAQIEHRTGIKGDMDKRRVYRRRRRYANIRYRKPRWKHRKRKDGWLPPSIQSRVGNIETWVRRLRTLCPITCFSYELNKFDTQKARNPQISGKEYQQGLLHGRTLKEYLLEEYDNKCCYCGEEHVKLEKEHIIPKGRKGSSNRADNLCLACRACNEAKGRLTAEEFGHSHIQGKVQKSLQSAALINATRFAVLRILEETGLPVECGPGNLTHANRETAGLKKDHHIDACCIGASTPDSLEFKASDVLYIKAKGRGKHKRTNTDDSGFPVSYLPRKKDFYGFQTGDMVKAEIPIGKYKGIWYGRVLCRSSGNFDITTKNKRFSVNRKYLTIVQANDGYEYSTATSSPRLKPGAPVA